ncbi:hypothetical protein [Pseudonocardia sp. ICBG1293]|uniref:hypothetical protein n=1 Tax=Pseudonocardia sp. ICBG1293 TaxID=2844382 RepID=UPI001CCFAC13|nr:hypothetical protein [Pseudonocardia sp. ICBG1293]
MRSRSAKVALAALGVVLALVEGAAARGELAVQGGGAAEQRLLGAGAAVLGLAAGPLDDLGRLVAGAFAQLRGLLLGGLQDPLDPASEPGVVGTTLVAGPGGGVALELFLQPPDLGAGRGQGLLGGVGAADLVVDAVVELGQPGVDLTAVVAAQHTR